MGKRCISEQRRIARTLFDGKNDEQEIWTTAVTCDILLYALASQLRCMRWSSRPRNDSGYISPFSFLHGPPSSDSSSRRDLPRRGIFRLFGARGGSSHIHFGHATWSHYIGHTKRPGHIRHICHRWGDLANRKLRRL